LEKKLLDRKQALKKRQKELHVEYRAKHKVSLLEPDARFMLKTDGLGYNAQAAVDTESKMIVAADVTNQANDQGQFIPLQKQAENNLSPDKKRAYTADAGYHNSKDLEQLEQNNVDVLIADPDPQSRSTRSEPTSADVIITEKRKIERTDFVYHQEGNYYECPGGDRLVKVKNKGKSTIYRARKCHSCPLAIYCLGSKKNYKQIHRSKREASVERMSVKLQSLMAKRRMYERRASSEPVFGNLKENLGFRRFSLCGIKPVKGEFTLMSIAHNINILYKRIEKRRLTAAVAKSCAKIDQHIALSKNILSKPVVIFYDLLKKSDRVFAYQENV
jgi:transposase